MLSWDTSVSSLSGRGHSPSPVPPTPPSRPDRRWTAWQGRLWRDLTVGAIPYALAHVLFWMHSRWGEVEVLSLDLVIAQLLFLLGTMMLWRVTRTLNEPVAPDASGNPQSAAMCLAVTVGLAFSPGVWWLFSLTG